MKNKKGNHRDYFLENKLLGEILDIRNARDKLNKQIELHDKLYEIHRDKALDLKLRINALDKSPKKDTESIKQQNKDLKKQQAQEKKTSKDHLRKKLTLCKKSITLVKAEVKKQIALQRILIKRANETVAVTGKKSDTNNLNKVINGMKKLEQRWESLTEIPWNY